MGVDFNSVVRMGQNGSRLLVPRDLGHLGCGARKEISRAIASSHRERRLPRVRKRPNRMRQANLEKRENPVSRHGIPIHFLDRDIAINGAANGKLGI